MEEVQQDELDNPNNVVTQEEEKKEEIT